MDDSLILNVFKDYKLNEKNENYVHL